MTQMSSGHWGDLVAGITATTGELVLGIDPDAARAPRAFAPSAGNANWIDAYVETLLSAATRHAGIVKFQSAYFEALGSSGVAALSRVVHRARSKGFAVILDAKRGDIGSTAAAYATAYLTPARKGGTDLEVDCMTVNPFLGPDSLEPFVDCARHYGKGLFVQVKNSNPGSAWLQDQLIGDERVSDRVGRLVDRWATQTRGSSELGNVGAVVGVTYPQDGLRLRAIMRDAIFLAPGFGMQGGRAEDIKLMRRESGNGVLLPVSRSVCDVAPEERGIVADEYHDLVQRRLADIAKQIA